MSVRLLVDMNLTPEWIAELNGHSWDAVHWSTVGDPRAADSVIMAWARENGYVVFTHDLDFGATLALTHASGPSVLQVRGQNVLPQVMGSIVAIALKQHEAALASGALVVVEATRSRVRVLPY